MIANNGELRAVYERLTFDDYKVSAAVIDLDKGHTLQAQNSDRNQLNTDNRRKINIDFTLPTTLPEKSIATDKSWESSIYIKEEEFARAFTLGLYDYMRKSRSKGFVISLSGGADSAAITAACRLMIEFGIESIGLEAFKNKLTYFPELSACKSADEISKMLIATAYQPTENSGQITQTAARELAKAIGAEFYIFDVNPVFKHYVDTLQSAIGRTLNWQQDDIALQNIQARVRAPSIWLLTNLRGALLLSTSNRSEAAVGYATMDGDTSGGLSPIAGIDKTFLRKWLVWLEKIGVDSHLRIPALSYINAQQPTAELRPPSSKQTDEQDLMPYEILNFIETAAIRDKKMPAECLVLLQFSYPDYEVEQLKTWIKKFFRLWCRNQWKRERYAPSFHFDDYNLDPRSWCRFPILSGGFEKELAEL
jgi:NAD+ synthase (glutamine-hydrolysing)